MNYHTRYAGIAKTVSICLVGSGAFGKSLLAQVRHIPKLEARIAVDITMDAAAAAFRSAGHDPRDIALCSKASEARRAYDDGKLVAADRLESVIDLPFACLIEATGHPESGAKHTLMAIEAGRDVVLVTKETDSVVGPYLATLAREAGCAVTPVDGDQPSLLIDLITWAETLGFDLLGAGKSSEYDFVFDAKTGTVTSNFVSHALPALSSLWDAGGDIARASAARRQVLGAHYVLNAVPDLCEMTLVANATGFSPDIAPFHAPVARIAEVPALFSQGEDGLFAVKRRLDVFHHLRAGDEASFAGGVFITLACQHAESWQILAEKGHVVSANGKTAMVYLPRHLLGLEAATSILDVSGLKLSAYGADYAPRFDLNAVATRDLAAGEHLEAKGHHHTIDGVGPEMRPASPLSANTATPYYLVANRRLAQGVKAGAAIRESDLELDESSVLLKLRKAQDARFLGA